MRMRFLSVVIALLLAAPLTACGGGDGKDLGPYVDAVAAEFADPSDEDSLALSKEQARCAAQHSIDAIGEDKVAEFDTPEDLVDATKEDLVALDLDDDTLDTIADDLVDCFGGVDFLLDFLKDAGATDEQVECVRGAVTDAELVSSVRADLAGETDEKFDNELGACLGG